LSRVKVTLKILAVFPEHECKRSPPESINTVT
jgi:hypothetical protein